MTVEELIPSNVLTNLRHLQQEVERVYAGNKEDLASEQERLEDYKRRLSLVPLYQS